MNLFPLSSNSISFIKKLESSVIFPTLNTRCPSLYIPCSYSQSILSYTIFFGSWGGLVLKNVVVVGDNFGY
jgi:hypothetical protein